MADTCRGLYGRLRNLNSLETLVTHLAKGKVVDRAQGSTRQTDSSQSRTFSQD